MGSIARASDTILSALFCRCLPQRYNLSSFYLFTHTNAASGSEAKSLLHLVPRDYGLIMRLIGGNVVRIVGELLTGYSPREGLYLPIFMGAGAGWGVWVGIRQSRTAPFLCRALRLDDVDYWRGCHALIPLFGI
ncbi:MAG UNVERIFIED_CONTAM: hypothetical protein LVT10_12330 [Anaerolineae bacterium]|jgi:hypothetical protein